MYDTAPVVTVRFVHDSTEYVLRSRHATVTRIYDVESFFGFPSHDYVGALLAPELEAILDAVDCGLRDIAK